MLIRYRFEFIEIVRGFNVYPLKEGAPSLYIEGKSIKNPLVDLHLNKKEISKMKTQINKLINGKVDGYISDLFILRKAF